MVSTAREPRAYELMAIVIPELADEDLVNEIQKISSHVTSATGAIKETLTDSPWGRRRLAYTVRHNGQDYRDGYYIVFHFDLEPNRMTEIERELKLDVHVMRYLLVHDDPKAGERNDGQQREDDATAQAPRSEESAPVSTIPSVVEPAAAPAASQSASDVSAPAAEEPLSNEAVPEADQPETDAAAPVAEEPITEEVPAVEEPAPMAENSPDEPAAEEAPAVEEPARVAENPPDETATEEAPAVEEPDNARVDAKQEG